MKPIIWLASFFVICFANPKSIPVYELLNGNQMPAIGFGTYKMTPEQVDVSVTSALENGYRHIDTAYWYENEKGIGNALKKWFAKGNRREDVFITTKLPMQAMRATDVETFLDLSLKDLKLDYVDMYLIHLPYGLERTADFRPLRDENGTFVIDFTTNHFEIWRALEKQVRVGKVKSIGLSNFNMTQVLRVWNFAEIKPSNLQIETNAYNQQDELRKFCRSRGIVVTGYGPLGSGDSTHTRRKREVVNLPAPIENPVITRIAKAHNKTAAQVLLRFDLQLNVIVIPKSRNPTRIQENIDIFDFHLTKREMKKIKSLDQHGRYRKFDFLTFTGVEHHPEYPFTDRIPQC